MTPECPLIVCCAGQLTSDCGNVLLCRDDSCGKSERKIKVLRQEWNNARRFDGWGCGGPGTFVYIFHKDCLERWLISDGGSAWRQFELFTTRRCQSGWSEVEMSSRMWSPVAHLEGWEVIFHSSSCCLKPWKSPDPLVWSCLMNDDLNKHTNKPLPD